MNVDQIKNIDDLVLLPPGKKILWHQVERLTAPGENYGSLMLSVDLKVTNSTGPENISLVVKMVPPNEVVQQIFNTQVTFRSEIAFYKSILPLLQEFQRENGVNKVINFAANYYGGRLNLSGTEDKVDADGALVLENLKILDYEMFDRTQGLNLDAAELVIKNLAQLHAVPLALKLQKPEVFQKEVKPYLSPWKLPKEFLENAIKDVARVIDMIEDIKPMKDRILAGVNKHLQEQAREPFATIVHNDCWSNNNMFKLEDNIPIDSKMVDFQIIDYGSPAIDIVFFIFSSVKNDVVENSYDKLIHLYHETFIKVLEELKCDTSEFTFEALLKEIEYEARNSQFSHSILMLFPIHAKKENIRELSDVSSNVPPPLDVSETYKEKFKFIVNQFAKRNWI